MTTIPVQFAGYRSIHVADEYKQLVALLFAGFGICLLYAVVNNSDWPLDKRLINILGRQIARIFMGVFAVIVIVTSITLAVFAPPMLNI